jgi:hypothetical protein
VDDYKRIDADKHRLSDIEDRLYDQIGSELSTYVVLTLVCALAQSDRAGGWS